MDKICSSQNLHSKAFWPTDPSNLWIRPSNGVFFLVNLASERGGQGQSGRAIVRLYPHQQCALRNPELRYCRSSLVDKTPCGDDPLFVMATKRRLVGGWPSSSCCYCNGKLRGLKSQLLIRWHLNPRLHQQSHGLQPSHLYQPSRPIPRASSATSAVPMET